MPVVIGEKRRTKAPGWYCRVEIDGVPYEVGVVVIGGDITPKPRVFGMVADGEWHKVWEGEVPASIGPRELLALAGLTS